MKSQITTVNFSAKKLISVLIAFFLVTGSFAGIIVTPASTTLNISADKAANATSPEFTSLNDIIVMESKANEFANTAGQSKTFILTAPAGWIFNTASGTVAMNSLHDFRSVSMKVNDKTIIVSFIVKGTTSIDIMTISGIEIKATDGAMVPCLGQIYVSATNPGTAKLPGLKMTKNTDGQSATNFGIMSQTTGNAITLAFATRPDSSIAGIAFEKQPVIFTQDQFGNATINGLAEVQNVKISLSAGTGTLSGTAVLNIGTTGGNGVVSFSDLKVNATGVKKLMARSGALTFAVTNEFVVTNANTASESSSEETVEEFDPELVCYSDNNVFYNLNSSSI